MYCTVTSVLLALQYVNCSMIFSNLAYSAGRWDRWHSRQLSGFVTDDILDFQLTLQSPDTSLSPACQDS